jgi:hypothetical protein
MGTPTLFIGDRLHDASDADEVLDAALRAAGGSPA